MRMRGVGEQLTPAPSLPACGLLLVNPGVSLATVAVFRARTGVFSPEAVLPNGWGTAAEMARSLSVLNNDLEAAAISLVPPIRDLLRAIETARGCLLSRMSGSGATCFGLFSSVAEAAAAAEQLNTPGWWCWGGALVG
jgi:4-diphosphocytidyl-2-C-methyl-D-erythritol kinase